MAHSFLITISLFFVSLYQVMAQDVYTNLGPTKQVRRVGGYIGSHANIVGFENARLWEPRFRVNPYVSWNAGLTIQEPVLARLFLNAGLSFVQLGLSTSYLNNYTPGGRYAAKSTGRSSHGLFTIPVSLQYNFRIKPKSQKHVFLGANIYYNLEERRGISETKSTIRDFITGDVATIIQNKFIVNQWIPSVMAGIGTEHKLSTRSSFYINLTGNIGLREITNTTIAVSIVNPSTLIKPILFTGNAINKGSHIGITLGILYSWRGNYR
jgi:hypothetical protein